ncbi:MAG: hypothetical protein ACPGYY_03135 [Bacteroidia bacterium]
MDNIEQEIKKRLAGSTSMEGIDSEALWNGISSTIHPAEASNNKKTFIFTLLFVCLVSIGSIFTLLTINKDSSTAYSPRTKINTDRGLSNTSSKTKQNSPIPEVKQNTVLLGNALPKVEKENTLFHRIENTTKHNNNESDKPNSEFQDARTGAKKMQGPSFSLSQTEQNIKAQSSLHPDTENILFFNKSESTSETGLSHTTFIDSSSVDSAAKNRKNSLKDSPPLIATESNESLSTQKSVEKVSNKVIVWKLYGGAVYMKQKFKYENSGLADSLNQSLSTQPSYSLGALVRIKQGKTWNLSVGMEYIEWKDRFDKIILSESVSEVDGEPVLLQNIRTIRHTNTASMITLPVQLGLFRDIRRFRLGMDVGVSYSLILAQNGRLSKNDFEIVDYSQVEKRFNNFFSARLAPYAGFKINEKIMVVSSCTLGIQSHETASINQLENNSVALMPSVGFAFNY